MKYQQLRPGFDLWLLIPFPNCDTKCVTLAHVSDDIDQEGKTDVVDLVCITECHRVKNRQEHKAPDHFEGLGYIQAVVIGN